MIGLKSDPWVACSPDAIAWMNPKAVGLTEIDGEVLWSVEIKTSVTTSSLDVSLGSTTNESITCTVGDDIFLNMVPFKERGQLIQQSVVLNVVNVITCKPVRLPFYCFALSPFHKIYGKTVTLSSTTFVTKSCRGRIVIQSLIQGGQIHRSGQRWERNFYFGRCWLLLSKTMDLSAL